MRKIDPLAPARGILTGIAVGAMLWAAIILTMITMGNQPYEQIAPVQPCDTDTDCMEKNPHIEFSLTTKEQ